MASILKQLKDEHNEVKSLLKKAEEATEAERSSLLEQIEEKLIPHARGEEKTLYAALLEQEKRKAEDVDLVQEAYEEHRATDSLLSDLKNTAVDYEGWGGKLQVLKENIEHHIKEEEEELFTEARQQFTDAELVDLKEVYLGEKKRFEESLPTQGQISERKKSPQVSVG